MDYQHYQQSAAISSYYHLRLTSPSPFPPASSSSLALKIKFLQANISRQANRGIRALQSNIKDITFYKRTIRGIIRYTIKLVRGTSSKKATTSRKAAAVVNSITVHVNVMNYSSSLHILAAPVVDDQLAYYNADWNSVIPTQEDATPLSGYLDWLEHRSSTNETAVDDDIDDDEKDVDARDINRRAESFIARCYEKFKLEKQESYRRYQEMMARSL